MLLKEAVKKLSLIPYFLGSSVHISIFDLYRLTKFMQGIREKVGSQRPIIKNLPKDPKDHHTTYEHPETRKGEIPSANFHGNARSLAKLASIMANKGKCEENGKQLFSEKTWTKMHDNSTWADDAILGIVCKLTECKSGSIVSIDSISFGSCAFWYTNLIRFPIFPRPSESGTLIIWSVCKG